MREVDQAGEGGHVFHDVVRWEPWQHHCLETGPWSTPPGSRPGMACRPLSCPGYTDAFLVAGLSDPSGTWQYMLLSSRTFNWILWPTCCPDLEGILGFCLLLCPCIQQLLIDSPLCARLRKNGAKKP